MTNIKTADDLDLTMSTVLVTYASISKLLLNKAANVYDVIFNIEVTVTLVYRS